jgi:hypothetical protein
MELAIQNGTSTSNGTATMWVNGTQVLNFTSCNMNQAIQKIVFQGQSTLFNMRIDDVVMHDSTGGEWNSRMGDIRIESVLPTANGTYTDWTLTGSSQHEAMADVLGAPDNTTSYVTDSVSGHKSTNTFKSIAQSPVAIFGVSVKTRALKSDSGTVNFKATCLSGGTSSDGVSQAPTTSYTWFNEFYTTDPNTSAQWTKTNLTNAEFGVKVV